MTKKKKEYQIKIPAFQKSALQIMEEGYQRRMRARQRKWRTRTRGTRRQVGTRFRLTERGSKENLPTRLRKVLGISEKERRERRLELLNVRLRRLQKELENALIEGMPVEDKVLAMNKIVQEIEGIQSERARKTLK